MQKLRVLPRGGVLVPRHESIMSGQKQFIGRIYDPDHGDHGGGGFPVAASVGPDSPIEVPSVGKGAPQEFELWQQYVREVRDGALWAADQATADACGVKFDPKFGGEFAAHSAAPSAGEA